MWRDSLLLKFQKNDFFLSATNYSHLVADMAETGPKWLLIKRIGAGEERQFRKWSQYAVQMTYDTEKLIPTITKNKRKRAALNSCSTSSQRFLSTFCRAFYWDQPA
jgi:uncharacterized protein Yka (UPF0111/DUF47 family)